MWRDVGRHTHGDTGTAVDEEIREGSGENDGLLAGLVVVFDEVDRLLLHVGHEHMTKVGKTSLGVSHRSRRVTFNGTKVTLAVDEDVPHRPRLSHVH